MKKNLRLTIALIVLIVLGLYFVFSEDEPDQDVTLSRGSYTEVRRGPLVIDVIESGTIKPRKQHVIKSQAEGRVAITFIVPEGDRVKKGDVLLKLESSSFEDRLASQEISAKNADANYTQAKENLAVTQNQADANREKAELDLVFAREDLVKYKAGEYPKTLNEAESKVTLAAEELKRAQDKLEWSTKLYNEKYLSESDFRTDQLSCRRYELELKSAQNSLQLLKQYTYKRQIAQLESDVRQAELSLERTKRKGNADVTQATAALGARELELKRQNEQMERWRDQIAKCTVYAPADGLVIYATSNQGPFRRSNQEPFDVGVEVAQRQDIIYLPEGEDFDAEIKVHETNLKKIYIGLPVRITVDALKGQIFTGHVSKIAPLPDAQSLFMNPDLKLYNVNVAIDDAKSMLKNGMNCRAEIVIQQNDDVLYVPIQCVVREKGKTVVYKKSANGDLVQPIEIGLDNNQFVHVKSGIQAGEEISLTPPLRKADKVKDNDKKLDKLDIPQRPEGQPAPAEGGKTRRMQRPDGAMGNIPAGSRPPQGQKPEGVQPPSMN